QREGGHIRMDILVGALRGRLLWLFELISVLLILVLMVALVWGSWSHSPQSSSSYSPSLDEKGGLIEF
ncbi:MAG: TRAP transporter small permease subunit, partial [Paracoccaceae bacterium]